MPLRRDNATGRRHSFDIGRTVIFLSSCCIPSAALLWYSIQEEVCHAVKACFFLFALVAVLTVGLKKPLNEAFTRLSHAVSQETLVLQRLRIVSPVRFSRFLESKVQLWSWRRLAREMGAMTHFRV